MTGGAVETGTAVRVVRFVPQRWEGEAAACLRYERALLDNYVGKVGLVVHVDGKDMPYRVGFGEDANVPVAEMRFYAEEVDEVG